MAYATPDVYIEEISTFPPSVAEVETAVPAFIGHTQKAFEFQKEDLHNKPKRVKSLLEFQQLYGFGAPVNVTKVELDENNAVSAKKVAATYYMYDAVRLYFRNGGGKCYIISVGNYDEAVAAPLFTTGLKQLEKQDEPTLILFPDAVKLEASSLYSLQQAALAQCAKLQDRFAILDLMESKAADDTYGWESGVNEFRDQIGMKDLKYGAAYTPWLRTNLGQDVRYRDIKGKLKRGGVAVTLSQLTSNEDVKQTITDLDNATVNLGMVESKLEDLRGHEIPTLKVRYQALKDDLQANPSDVSKLEAILGFVASMVVAVDDWADNVTIRDPAGANLKKDLDSMITNSVAPVLTALAALDLEAVAELATGSQTAALVFVSVALTDALAAAAAGTDIDGGGIPERLASAQTVGAQLFERLMPALLDVRDAARAYETNFENELREIHPVFSGIIRHLNQALTLSPPSGAVVGAMASVDSNRGVWKAPANVSLSSVIEPSHNIDNVDQASLNIDTVAGKSINAIRKFTGKGTLIWGARTLMGNDNEWRYINVRRFFNMVEESVKKSTYWAVFESNDANTWIKVKSMIENYLTQKWRDGALQGSKADQAFFVQVGLGTTMTPMDILEGRMHVEIGMAVVRPAEFIVLKFSHKMPEA